MNDKPETNKWIIFLIILTLAVNATIGVGTLSYCLISQTDPNAALLTAFVAIVNFVLGAISGMLVKTAPTESTRQPLPNPPPPPTSLDNPMPVKPITSVADPVHTEEASK